MLGVFDAIGRVIFLDKTVPLAKLPFLKLHEAGHAALPWQNKIYAFVDCEKTLSPEAADLFDREANVFAAEVMFQLDGFQKEASDHNFDIKVPLKLSKRYGASTYSSIRQYVTKNHYACAVLVLDMPQPHPEFGYTAALRRKPDASAEFNKLMGNIEWPNIFTPHDDLGALVPLNGKRMSGRRSLALVNRNGDTVECVAESFTNTYQVFVLVLVKDTLKKKSFIIPTPTEIAAIAPVM